MIGTLIKNKIILGRDIDDDDVDNDIGDDYGCINTEVHKKSIDEHQMTLQATWLNIKYGAVEWGIMRLTFESHCLT